MDIIGAAIVLVVVVIALFVLAKQIPRQFIYN